MQRPEAKQQAADICRRFTREQRQHMQASGNNPALCAPTIPHIPNSCTQHMKIQTESENFKDQENFKVKEAFCHAAQVHAKLCFLISNSFLGF